MNIAEIESKKALQYAVDLAAQARLSGGTPGGSGCPDVAMLERYAAAVNQDRNIAARAMAMYERIVAGDQFEVKPDGSIAAAVVKSKRRDTP